MENNVLNYTTADIFKNGDITIEIPLTGKNVPTVFKTFIVECITRGEGRNILGDDDLLNELLERQKEGIAIAKRNGVYKGRKPKAIPNFEKYYGEYMMREINKVEFAMQIGVSRVTLDKLIKEYVNR